MNRHEHTSPDASRQRGSIVVYLAIVLVAFGVLAMAGGTRFGASILGVSAPNCATQARLMAESGVRYATAYLRMATSAATLATRIADLNGQTYAVNNILGQSFTLTVTASGAGAAQVSAVGRSCNGVSAAATTASAAGGVNVPAAGGGGGTPGEGVSFATDIASFVPTSGFGGQAGVTVNVGAKTISLGNSLFANSASVWYTGSRDVCTQGNCTLGNGLCAYFQFDFTSSSTGDGFVWTLMSGDANTNASNGGDTGRGELLGYGGLGSSGLGIQPPKFGVEFDIYNNGCAASACNVGSRCDATAKDHMAHLFWGSQTLAGCSATYDDNRHDAGTSGSTTEPRNSDDDDSSTGHDGYYYRGGGAANDWMKAGGSFYYRFELDRSTTPNAQGNYCYQVRSWLKKPGDAYPAGLSNCTAAYTGPPDATSVVNLSPAMHQKLTKVFFGWTEGTGGATQLATLRNFALSFKPAPTTPIVPQDYVAGWSFYEGSGATVRDMNATNRNDGAIPPSVQWVPGVYCPNCSALRFTGSNYVAVPSSASLRLTTAGSIAAWINIQNYEDSVGIVHKGVDAYDDDYSLQFATGRRVRLNVNHGSDVRRVDTAAPLSNDNQWYHVAATWDASVLKIYVNGVLSNTTANTGSRSASLSTAALTIGAQQMTSPNYGFRGLIDEVYVYNRALTATEISNMARSAYP